MTTQRYRLLAVMLVSAISLLIGLSLAVYFALQTIPQLLRAIDSRTTIPDQNSISLSDEYELIEQILTTSSVEERTKLISRFEEMPIRIHQFHKRWMIINKVFPSQCWMHGKIHSIKWTTAFTRAFRMLKGALTRLPIVGCVTSAASEACTIR
jgi:hypothetical protein